MDEIDDKKNSQQLDSNRTEKNIGLLLIIVSPIFFIASIVLLYLGIDGFLRNEYSFGIKSLTIGIIFCFVSIVFFIGSINIMRSNKK